jgi:hypothetical protein
MQLRYGNDEFKTTDQLNWSPMKRLMEHDYRRKVTKESQAIYAISHVVQRRSTVAGGVRR